MKIRIAWTVVLSVITTQTMAATGTGNQLLESCQTVIRLAANNDDTDSLRVAYGAGECLGFVHGVRRMTSMLTIPESIRSCVPQRVTNGQLARVTVKYLEENPAQLDGEQTLLTLLAFKDAFPCK